MSFNLQGRSAYVRVFGCQMNVYDGQLVETMLRNAGCSMVDDPSEADIAVFVTCSVRAHAEDRVFSLLGRLRLTKLKRQGKPVIGVMGCAAQRLGAKFIKRYPYVDFVIGTHNLDAVVEAAAAALDQGRQTVAVDTQERYVLESVSARPASSYFAYVPVARGCSRQCAYCIVPHVRGRMSSRKPEDILAQVKELTDNGCTEITLLGQNIDAYGRDISYKSGLAGLLKEVAQFKQLDRLNFITSHPADFKDDLLPVIVDNPVISPFFHLPPQSGSDTVLKRMRRGYTRSYYLDLVGRIYEALPQASVAGDFIVGFPGETEADFDDSLSMMREVGFQQAYVFKYSPREGTTAASEMVDDVPNSEKKRRNNAMLKVQEEIQLQKNHSMIGQSFDVIVEGPSKSDETKNFGRTSTCHRIVFDEAGEQAGEKVRVEITDVTALTLFGKKVS